MTSTFIPYWNGLSFKEHLEHLRNQYLKNNPQEQPVNTAVPFDFSWVVGSRHDIHNPQKVRSTKYEAVMHIDSVSDLSYKELFSRYSNSDIPSSFWVGWRLIKAGNEIDWDELASPQPTALHLVRRIGHWSRIPLEANPLMYFPCKVWKEKHFK